MGSKPAAVLAALLILGSGASFAAKVKGKAKDKRQKEQELMAMAELAENVGDFDKTLAVLDELRRLCAQKGPPCLEKDSALLEQIGWVCLRSKACAPRRPALIAEIARVAPKLKELLHDLKESLQSPNEAEQDEKEHADSGDKSGRVDYETPGEKASIPELEEHLQKHPGDLDARMDLADALLESGKKEEGVRELSIYLESRPADLEAREQLIDALIALERRSGALSEIGNYLRRKPKAWKMRALEIELLLEEKRTRDLERALQALIRDAPDHGLAYAYLADLALQRDEPEEAARDLAKARTATSTDAETLEKIKEVERDLVEARAQIETGFRKDVRRYDFEDDLRYGGETE